jgi:tape measure domain-containing protein
MTSNFTALGQSMTRSLTLPIAAFGAAAIKSAADLEQLETSFVSLTGGAREAAFMMSQLNEFTAKTPFQIDAVAKAARQLIASGTEMSEVNEQLQFLGDIAATSGTSIDEIAAIFAKVNAKGKVELENLNQLAERGIPIFKALADATGLPADKLGAGAVSVDQFNQVLKSFAQEGGFAAGAMERLSETALGKFSTALDNVKLALGSIGERFLPVVTRILDGIVAMSQAFANLSPFVQRVLIVVGTFAAALGPLLIAIPKLIGVVTGLRAAMTLLNITMIANPAVAVAAGIAALAAVIVGYNVDVGNAIQTTHDWRMELLKLNNEGKKIELEQRIQSANDALDEHLQILDRFRQLRDNAQLPSEQLKWQRAMESHQLIIDAINTEIGAYTEELVKVEKAIDDAAAAQRRLNLAAAGGVETLSQLFGKLDEVSVKSWEAQMSLYDLFSTLDEIQVPVHRVTEATSEMAQTIAGAFESAARSAASFADFLRAVTVDIVASYLRQAAAKALATGNFAAAIGLGVASGLSQRVAMPAFADGGLVYGPTTALIGDNKNARIDPEVVAPLSKLRDMMGGNQVEVFGRISGNDIFLSNSRTGTSRNRYA